MRNRLPVLLCLCLGWMLSFHACAAVWSIENDRLVRYAGEMRSEVALPAGAGLLAPRGDGGIWVGSGDELWSLDAAGQVMRRVIVSSAGLGKPIALAADAYDDSVWVATDEPLLLHVAADGTLAHGTTLAAPATALTVDLAQDVWLVAGSDLLHFARDGRGLGTWPLDMAGDETVRAVAIDALHARIWLATSTGVDHASLDKTALVRTRAVRGDATALAIDGRSGTTLAIVDDALVAFDDTERRQATNALPPIDEVVVGIAYDADGAAFRVDTTSTTMRIASDGRVLAREPPRGSALRAGTPLRIEPMLALLRPPGGAAVTDPHAEIVMHLWARCNDVACNLPQSYVDTMRLAATLDDVSLGEASVAHDGRATFPHRPPMTPGGHTLTAAATDMFGHTATLEPARWTFLSGDSPGTTGPPAPDGSRSEASVKAANKAPIVTLASPVNGSRFPAGAAVTLTATATDPDGSIAKVEFYAGATLIGVATASPYQYVWGNALAGTYSVTAKAYDNRRAMATSAAVSIVVVDNLPPTVQLTSPASGFFATPGSTVTLVASAADPDGTIARIDFLDGTTPIGAITQAPYQLAWNASTPGHHAITARATDNAGAAGQSSPIDIVVGQLPVVVVTSPIACSTMDGPLNVYLTADAASTTGNIAAIEFFDNDASVGVATAAPWSVMLVGAAMGGHSITAKATDSHGLVATSRPSTFTVRGPNQPPSVAMLAPTEGAHVPFGASIDLAANASDPDGRVTAVEFRIGSASGALIGRTTVTPYAATWRNAATGAYAILAVAYDDRNAATTSAPVHLTVDANVPPSVAITAPAANARYMAPANVAVTATANDADGSITRVEFFSGGTSIGVATAPPFSVMWSGVAAGAYTLTARATDNAGGTAISAPVPISVVSNALPTVTLTAPASGTQFFAPATISLAASAQDSDGSIAGVDFYANGVLVGHAATSPYRAVWDGAAAGTYTLTARATDNLGGMATSAPLNVIVTGGPSVNIDSALQGATIDDDNVLVRGFVNAPANSAVTVNGVVTHIDDFGRFQANDVPLVPGENTVEVVVTTQDGQTTSQSITLGSSGAGAFVVHASPTEGLESLQVTITIENPGNTPFKQINLDLENDGFPNLIVTPDQFSDGKVTIAATYPVGTWIFVIKAYDNDDKVIYSTTKSVVVHMPQILQGTLQGIYEGMLSRLRAGNMAGALTTFTGSAHDKYDEIFSALQPSLADIVDQLGAVTEITFNMDIAEITLERDTPDGPQRFMIYLVRSEDGIWRIDDM